MAEELTLDKVIDFAVEAEKLGLHFYGKLARRFADDGELHELFANLARDEEQHARRFASLREKLPPRTGAMQYEQQQYLRAIALSDIFSKSGTVTKELDRIETRVDALQRAFDLERTTLLYYEAMQDILGDEPVLAEIISEEKRHVVSVMRYLVTDTKFRGLDDSF